MPQKAMKDDTELTIHSPSARRSTTFARMSAADHEPDGGQALLEPGLEPVAVELPDPPSAGAGHSTVRTTK